jgi:hypothetical protein
MSGFELEVRSGDIPIDYNPPGMRCCAGSRAHRKTIPLPGPSNAAIGMSSPPPSNLARRRSRKGKRRLVTATLVYGLFTISKMREREPKRAARVIRLAKTFLGAVRPARWTAGRDLV